MNKEEKTLEERIVFTGRIITLHNDKVLTPQGNITTREYVHHPGGACILALFEDKIVFERQFRYPYREEVFELPAGKIEEGEDPSITVSRELEEETGLKSLGVEYLGLIYPTCGGSDEKIYLYFSPNNVKSHTNYDPDEIIDLEYLSIKDAYDKLDRGEIVDAKTICCMEKLRKRLNG